MSKKKKETMELRVYEIPSGHSVLVLHGESWIMRYGEKQSVLHFHNLMEIGICRYGNGELRMQDKTLEYKDGLISVFPANCPHTTYSYGEENNFWEYLFFDLKSIVSEIYPDSPVYANEVIEALNLDAFILNDGNDSLKKIIDSIIEEAAGKNHYHHQIMDYYMKILILEIMRLKKDVPYYAGGPAKTSNSRLITKSIEYIMANYDKQIKVSELADICNMSETHFRRIFEEYIDMSPMDYVNYTRIGKACEMMKKTDIPMNIVAEKCGFPSVSTFNRNFKKFLDTTPYQWKIDPGNYEGSINKYHISPKPGW